MSQRRFPLAVALAAVIASSCSVGTVADSSGPSAPGDTTGNDPGTIQRATLTVRVSFDPGDAALATQAGISVAGLHVRLERQASTSPPSTATTDASGIARFESLLEGTYTVSADRPLTDAERAALPVPDADVTVFAGARRVSVAPPTPSTTIELVASRRGSLVLSEFFFSARANTVGTTGDAHYAEIFNASDTTIYLDGMLFFQTSLNMHRMVLEQYECDVHNAEQRLDPDGIWALFIFRFPGAGQTFRVEPGRAVVLAVDATDHSLIHPDLPDLRAAQFEILGAPSDPDNPGAVNMIPFRTQGTPSGANFISTTLLGIALPVARDTNDLERTTIVNTSTADGQLSRVWKIPRDAVLDVGAFVPTPDREVLLPGVVCEPFINPVFDRAAAPLQSDLIIRAIARKSLGFTNNGIEMLQRTRTSERDFDYAPSPLLRSLGRQ
jgi:hypothetical protein